MERDTGDQTRVVESLNPVLHLVLKTEVDNRAGDSLYDLDRQVQYTGLPEDELRSCLTRERAIDQAILLMLGLQVPAAFASYLLSPSLEWELIIGCFLCLLALKGFAALVSPTQSSSLVILLGAILANVVTGAMCGEVLHFLVDLLHSYCGTLEGAASMAAAALVVSFYTSFIGDILYIKRNPKIRREIRAEGETLVVVDSRMELRNRDRWWLIWGLSTSAMWSPVYIFYLFARLLDYVTAVFLLDFIGDLFFIVGRRRR